MKSGRPATPNLLQNLARASWNRSAALAIATALLALAPAARAEQFFEFKGQKVYYENAEYKEIVDAATGETLPVLIFREDG